MAPEKGPKGPAEIIDISLSNKLIERSKKNLGLLKPQSRKAFIEAVNEKFGEDFDTSAVPEEEAFYELLFESLKAAEVLGQDKESEGVTGPKAREHIFESLKALEEQLEELRTQRQEEIDTFAQENEQYTQACDELSQRLKQAETKREILRIARDLEDVRSHAERSHEIVQLERQKEGMEFHEFKYELQAENPGLTTEGFRRFYEQQKAAINEQERAKLEELLGGETLIGYLRQYMEGVRLIDTHKRMKDFLLKIRVSSEDLPNLDTIDIHEEIISTLLNAFSPKEIEELIQEVEKSKDELLDENDIVFHRKPSHWVSIYYSKGKMWRQDYPTTALDNTMYEPEEIECSSCHRSKVPSKHKAYGTPTFALNIQGRIKTRSQKLIKRMKEAVKEKQESNLDRGIPVYAQMAQEFDRWFIDPFEGMEGEEENLYRKYILGKKFYTRNPFYEYGKGGVHRFTGSPESKQTVSEYFQELLKKQEEKNRKDFEHLRTLSPQDWQNRLVESVLGKRSYGYLSTIGEMGDYESLRVISERVKAIASDIKEDILKQRNQIIDRNIVALWIKDGKTTFMTQEQYVNPRKKEQNTATDYVIELEERVLVRKDGEPITRGTGPKDVRETDMREILFLDIDEKYSDIAARERVMQSEIQYYLQGDGDGFNQEKAFEICRKIDHNREINKRIQFLTPEERLEIGNIMHTYLQMKKSQSEQMQLAAQEETEKIQEEIGEKKKVLGFIGRRISSRGYPTLNTDVFSSEEILVNER